MRTSAAQEERIERGGRGEERRDPTEWPRVRLGDHADKIGSGLTPNGGHAAYVDEGIPLIRSQNVHMGRFDPSGLVRITPEQDEEMSGSRVQRGDVLLNITGASIGRVCVAPDHLVPANVNQHVCIIRSDGSWHPDFLGRFLSTPSFQRFILGDQAGATRQALTKAQIEDFRIPLPPLAEQERIAGRLTEQLGAVERARAAAAQRLAAAEALPAALLRAVFEGTEASGWETRTLGELCDGNGQYGTSAKSNGMERGLPVLGMPHIHEGRIRWVRVSYADLPPDELDKYRLVKGDLLFNRTNSAELVGKTAVFDGARDAVFASYLIRFRVRADMADPRFISAYINSRQGRAFIERYMTRAIGQVNISASTMIGMPIPCPPASRQREIMDHEYSPRLAAAEGVIARCREELAAIEALPAALLRDAFGGGRDGEEQEAP